MDLQTITGIRRFNRFYSPLLGVLNGNYLSSPYTLPELRILHELAKQPNVTASSLAKSLNMDMGYMSRLVRSLSRKRLIKRTRQSDDKRNFHLSLTAFGLKQQPVIEQQANQHIETLITPISSQRRQRLVQAMDTIRDIMEGATAPVIFRQLAPGDAGWIVHRHGAVIAKEFGWNMEFEALCAQIMADFIRNYQPQWERSWIVERGGEILGSLFLVRQDETTAKLRLLYVDPNARGMGLATKLLEKSIQFARSRNYQKLTLFTTSSNVAARRIYDKLGMVLAKEESLDFAGERLQGEHWELLLTDTACEDHGKFIGVEHTLA